MSSFVFKLHFQSSYPKTEHIHFSWVMLFAFVSFIKGRAIDCIPCLLDLSIRLSSWNNN